MNYHKEHIKHLIDSGLTGYEIMWAIAHQNVSYQLFEIKDEIIEIILN